MPVRKKVLDSEIDCSANVLLQNAKLISNFLLSLHLNWKVYKFGLDSSLLNVVSKFHKKSFVTGYGIITKHKIFIQNRCINTLYTHQIGYVNRLTSTTSPMVTDKRYFCVCFVFFSLPASK